MNKLKKFFGLKFFQINKKSDPQKVRQILAKEASMALLVPNDFDATEYVLLNPDIAESGIDPVEHYSLFGSKEGRIYKSGKVTKGKLDFDLNLKTCLLITHDLGLSGSPMLAINLAENFLNKVNLVILSYTNSGKLLENFLDNCCLAFTFNTNPKNFKLIESAIKDLLKFTKIDYAIANSSITNESLLALNSLGIPSVSLIHEFASYAPEDSVLNSIKNSDIAVFSAKATLRDAREFLNLPLDKDFPIIFQGLNQHGKLKENSTNSELEKRRIDKEFEQDKFNVVGIGSLIMTKGADLFIQTAQYLEKIHPNKFKFIWFADTKQKISGDYRFFIFDALKRSRHLNNFTLLDETFEIEYLLNKADCFALTSRLDTMASVAIEALSHAKPVVCFENTGGIPDLLVDAGFGEQCVANYLSINDLAKKISDLESDRIASYKLGEDLKLIATNSFNSDVYATKILEICERSANKVAN